MKSTEHTEYYIYFHTHYTINLSSYSMRCKETIVLPSESDGVFLHFSAIFHIYIPCKKKRHSHCHAS